MHGSKYIVSHRRSLHNRAGVYLSINIEIRKRSPSFARRKGAIETIKYNMVVRGNARRRKAAPNDGESRKLAAKKKMMENQDLRRKACSLDSDV